jgi:hypothetical protein
MQSSKSAPHPDGVQRYESQHVTQAHLSSYHTTALQRPHPACHWRLGILLSSDHAAGAEPQHSSAAVFHLARGGSTDLITRPTSGTLRS